MCFFSSVVAVDKTIREEILKDVTAKNYSVLGFTLLCSEATLLERHKKRGGYYRMFFSLASLSPTLR